jgi:flagellar biosynthesis chaperone FliJ
VSESEVRELESQLIDMSDQLGEARAVVTDLQDQVDRLERHSRALEQAYTEQGSRLVRLGDLNSQIRVLEGTRDAHLHLLKTQAQQIEHAIRLLDELQLQDAYDENQLNAAIDILKGACGQ